MKNLVSINNLTELETFSLIRKALILKKENPSIRQYNLLVPILFFKNITRIKKSFQMIIFSLHRIRILYDTYKIYEITRYRLSVLGIIKFY